MYKQSESLAKARILLEFYRHGGLVFSIREDGNLGIRGNYDLREVDRQAILAHRELFLDLLWEDLQPGPDPNWPHNHPNWEPGVGWRWVPMTTTEGFTPEVEEAR